MLPSVNLKIETYIDGDVLYATLVPEDGVRKGDVFFTYVLKQGAVHIRSDNWVDTPHSEWKLTESGLYSIQGHIKRDGVNIMSFSLPVPYMTEDNRQKFDEWKSSPANDIQGLNIEESFRASTPYVDFLLVSGVETHNILEDCKSFAEKFKLDIAAANESSNNLILANPGHIHYEQDKPYVFSGSCFLEDQLVFGGNDLDSIEKITSDEPVGNYTWVSSRSDENTMSCGTDYFGIAKLYYLQTAVVSIASNNYHLMLLLARKLGVSLSVDIEKAASTLVFATMQPFHQNFTRRMDISPIKALPADKKMTMKDGEITIKDTSLADTLNNPKEYHPEEYETLIHRAKSDILSHVESVLRHPAFTHIVCDLSGGLDSRLVFCALTHFPEFAEKIHVNSHFSAAEPDDLVVAQEVASFFNFKFDDLPRKEVLFLGEKFAFPHWSYNLGAYFSYIPLHRDLNLPATARLNGFFGEICARPYYARRMFDTDLDTKSVDAFCDRYFSKHQRSAFGCDEATFETLKQLFAEELEAIPGRSVLEKFDNHYLFYRNGLHTSDRFRINASCPEFGPIQSKALRAAKTMGYHKFRGAKAQYDIINLLNPALASYRYENKFDNEDIVAVRSKFGILGEPWSENLHMTAGDVAEKWKEAKNRIVVDRFTKAEDELRDMADRDRTFEADHFGIALDIVKYLTRNNEVIKEDLAAALWLEFSGSVSKTASLNVRWNILNRLVSLYIQIRIVSDNESLFVPFIPKLNN